MALQAYRTRHDHEDDGVAIALSGSLGYPQNGDYLLGRKHFSKLLPRVSHFVLKSQSVLLAGPVPFHNPNGTLAPFDYQEWSLFGFQ